MYVSGLLVFNPSCNFSGAVSLSTLNKDEKNWGKVAKFVALNLVPHFCLLAFPYRTAVIFYLLIFCNQIVTPEDLTKPFGLLWVVTSEVLTALNGALVLMGKAVHGSSARRGGKEAGSDGGFVRHGIFTSLSAFLNGGSDGRSLAERCVDAAPDDAILGALPKDDSTVGDLDGAFTAKKGLGPPGLWLPALPLPTFLLYAWCSLFHPNHRVEEPP